MMGKEQIDPIWFQSICSTEEIERIKNVQNGRDHILRLRAETIADNIRLYRVFLHLARHYGDAWALEKYFTAYNYIEIRNSLSPEHQDICKTVSFGSIITSDPNGLIFQTPYGVCSTFSTSIKYFSHFMSLAFLKFDKEVPQLIKVQAVRIAVRTMLKREALDFEVDPRGIIPKEITHTIQPVYVVQTEFIAAHEYSHLINGDLKSGGTMKCAMIKAKFADETDYRMLDVYNSSQIKEFKADIGAMTYPMLSPERYSYYYFSTMLWFAYLAVYEAAENVMFPAMGRPSHPGAKARYENILNNAPRPVDYDADLYERELPGLVSNWEDFVKDDVMANFDEIYEPYGSVYLGPPDTEWRGHELIDRVDY